jgi:zinc/manganese transport system permease protein
VDTATVAAFFADPAYQRALLAGILLAVACAPLGGFLILRRMSLIGDAFGHAILPGAAGAALLSGGAVWAISLGAALTGTLVFVSASIIGRVLRLPEDAGFALFFLTALALGVIISAAGASHVHLDDLLFGSALKLNDTALFLCGLAVVTSIGGIALIYRPLVIDTVDPAFLSLAGGKRSAGSVAQAVFFGLLAVASVASFHALGALMAVGMMIVPAIGARYLAHKIVPMMLGAGVLGILGVIAGLFVAFVTQWPAGACIILTLTGLAFACALIGPVNSVAERAGLWTFAARRAAV